MSTVEGYVERIVYRNDDNGYSVLSVSSGGKEITMVGTFPSISQGEYLCATGEETEHPMYGPQLQVEEYSFVAPSDAESTERYLGSGAVKGVGAALAARIVRQFGDDTFRIIEEEPERLAEIKGISERRAMEIAGQVAEKRDMRKAVIFLQQYGISLNLAVKIYQQYGQELCCIILSARILTGWLMTLLAWALKWLMRLRQKPGFRRILISGLKAVFCIR